MKTILALGIAAFAGQVFAADTLSPLFDIRSYGAKGDGVALDSPAIDKAIAAAHGAGGGIVILPAGTWLSGTIHLQSNVTLDLGPGNPAGHSRPGGVRPTGAKRLGQVPGFRPQPFSQ